MPAKAAGGAAPDDVRMSPQGVEQLLSERQAIDEQMLRGIIPAPGNALAYVGGSLFAKSLELGNSAIPACLFELLDAVDPKLVMNHLDFFGADPWNFEHGHKSGRNGGLEFLEVNKPASRNEFGDFLLERISNPGDLAETVFRDNSLERLIEAFERAGSIGIRPGFERVLAFQFEEHGDLVEHFSHLSLVHRRKISDLSK